jgi:diguanylate cyclase (GGDEF)-like protein
MMRSAEGTSGRRLPHRPRTIALWLAPILIGGGLWTAFLLDDTRLGQIWLIAALAALFLLCESAPLNIEFRRQTYSLALAEIPIVLGLFLLPPLGLLVARMTAGSMLLFDGRRQRGKQIFNIGIFAVELGIAEIIFQSVRGPDVADPLAWLVALAAVLCADLASMLMVTFAIVVTSGWSSWRRLLANARRAAITSLVGSTVGLVVLVVVHVSAWGALLLAGIVSVLIVVYRAYGRFLRQHEGLGQVYEFSKSVERARSDPTVVGAAVAQAREMLNASSAVLWTYSTEDTKSVVVTAFAEGRLRTEVVPTDIALDALRSQAAGSRRGRRFSERDGSASGVAAALARRGAKEMIIAPLRTSDRLLGTLELQDRQGQLGSYDQDDLRLLETLATHLTVAIENQQLVERLRHTAYHDRLTGLPNRARLAQHLDEAVSGLAGEDGVIALCQFDIDRFKEVNDSLGHSWGDKLLNQVGARLKAEAPSGSVVARVGADEFAVLLKVADEAGAEQTARHLRTAVAAPYTLADLAIDVSASVGLAIAPEHGTDADTLMRRVDVALSSAKSTGRSVTMYHAGLDQASLHRLRLVTGLREALAAGQLVVRYQPKINLRSKELVGVEALVRWNHPEFGEVVPDDFVQLAEVTGLVGSLTMHVLQAAIGQCRQWLDRDLRIPVAVNLSARNLLEPDFPEQVAEMLARYNVPAELLMFELTEGSVMTDPDKMKPILHRLHELGTELSIDDFGTGYSSLSQLRRLPVDEVKIDKVFVLSMGTDLGDLAIVRAIIELGHSLGLRVVAEGVEDELARDLLAGNDCDVVQGFLVSRALDPERLDAWLSARTTPRPAQPGMPGRRLQLLTG